MIQILAQRILYALDDIYQLLQMLFYLIKNNPP